MNRPPGSTLRILALGIALAACSKEPEAVPAEEGATAEVEVTTALVAAGAFEESATISGIVVPRNGTVAQVSVPVATRILKVHVASGQSVKAGDPLIDLDRVAIDAELERAYAVYLAADSNYSRAQRLSAQGILPRRDVEQAARDRAEAKAALTSAQRIGALATLTAPIAGVITRLAAIPGAAADPAVALVEITNPTDVEVAFTVPVDLASRIHQGSSITLVTNGHDTLGRTTVLQIFATVDTATRGVEIRASGVHLKRALRIGEPVTGEITLATSAHALIVPIEALVPAEDGFQVFLVDGEHVAHAQVVEVAGRNARFARVTSGLKAGDRIVTIGAFGLDDGVKVVEKGATKEPKDS